jgi:hypothetical protein
LTGLFRNGKTPGIAPRRSCQFNPKLPGCKQSLTEQRQHVLRVGVGDRQSLDTKLLLCLQSFQAGRFLVHVRVDQTTDTLVIESIRLETKSSCIEIRLLTRTEVGSGVSHLREHRVDNTDHVVDLGIGGGRSQRDCSTRSLRYRWWRRCRSGSSPRGQWYRLRSDPARWHRCPWSECRGFRCRHRSGWSRC